MHDLGSPCVIETISVAPPRRGAADEPHLNWQCLKSPDAAANSVSVAATVAAAAVFDDAGAIVRTGPAVSADELASGAGVSVGPLRTSISAISHGRVLFHRRRFTTTAGPKRGGHVPPHRPP